MRTFRLKAARSLRICAWAVLPLALGLLTGCANVTGFSMNRFGTAAYNRGDTRLAADYFQRATLEDPTVADYYYNLASAQWRQRDLPAAEQNYQAALRLDPLHQPAYRSLASVLETQGRTEEAYELLEGYAAVQPRLPGPRVELARLQQRHGEFAAAEQQLTVALKNRPRHSEALAELASVQQQQGRTGEAVANYRRSLSLDARQPEVRQQLASLTRPQQTLLRSDAWVPPANGSLSAQPQFANSNRGRHPHAAYDRPAFARPPMRSGVAQRQTIRPTIPAGRELFANSSHRSERYPESARFTPPPAPPARFTRQDVNAYAAGPPHHPASGDGYIPISPYTGSQGLTPVDAVLPSDFSQIADRLPQLPNDDDPDATAGPVLLAPNIVPDSGVSPVEPASYSPTESYAPAEYVDETPIVEPH